LSQPLFFGNGEYEKRGKKWKKKRKPDNQLRAEGKPDNLALLGIPES
jgi:hypothetical protein